jgi:hypothetical protein
MLGIKIHKTMTLTQFKKIKEALPKLTQKQREDVQKEIERLKKDAELRDRLQQADKGNLIPFHSVKSIAKELDIDWNGNE